MKMISKITKKEQLREKKKSPPKNKTSSLQSCKATGGLSHSELCQGKGGHWGTTALLGQERGQTSSVLHIYGDTVTQSLKEPSILVFN